MRPTLQKLLSAQFRRTLYNDYAVSPGGGASRPKTSHRALAARPGATPPCSIRDKLEAQTASSITGIVMGDAGWMSTMGSGRSCRARDEGTQDNELTSYAANSFALATVGSELTYDQT